MARNTVPIIIGAVLFGLLAIGLTFYSLLGGGSAPAPETASAQTPQPEPASRVFLARRPIYPRTVITRDMIEESEGTEPPANAIVNPYDVVGRLANRTIQAGQIITTDSVTSGLGRVIPANIPIPAGLRGVAVWVDPDQTAAGLVDIGDRIDVIATHELQLEKTDTQTVIGATQFTAGRTIAQDLEVLAVDRSITEMRPSTPAPTADQPATPDATTPDGAQPSPTPPPPAQQPGQERRTRVILAAPPEVAQRLVAANAQGQLHITIRNPGARDQFPVAESREYPSRMVAAPQARPATTAGGGGGGEGRSNASPGRSEPPMMPGPFLPPQAQPLPPFNPNAGAPVTTPQPVPEKDVTVIRGTEKTRVIVPR